MAPLHRVFYCYHDDQRNMGYLHKWSERSAHDHYFEWLRESGDLRRQRPAVSLGSEKGAMSAVIKGCERFQQLRINKETHEHRNTRECWARKHQLRSRALINRSWTLPIAVSICHTWCEETLLSWTDFLVKPLLIIKGHRARKPKRYRLSATIHSDKVTSRLPQVDFLFYSRAQSAFFHLTKPYLTRTRLRRTLSNSRDSAENVY